jgi:steroid delta-isomerase-like uncharacterized protein
MSLDQNKALVRRAADAQDQGDDDRFIALLGPNYRVHFPGQPAPLDREGHAQLVRAFRAAFPDGEHEIVDQIAEGDTVATRGVWRGTHLGEFQGLPASGRRVAITWIMFARVAGQQLVEVWLQADFLGLMQQIGAVPAPGPAAAPV